MRPQEIIAKKRDGGELSRAEIDAFIDGVCDVSWADYQTSALVMAMFVRGLNDEEQNALTYAMLNSGEVLDLANIAKPKADKHSTGGVGDKTSLIIAPIAAACGIAVPMISGRGLGHTGGTLDKLESIPGYKVDLETTEFRRIVEECGFAMSGQTAEIAPADKKLYALRDATATVPYIPLIVASIMSKKLAEGLDALILDVKTGSGAFMQQYDDSVRLAEALAKTGRDFGVKTQAVVSDMSQPLGKYVGNSLEVYECVQILRGDGDANFADTRELSIELSARLLVLCGQADGIENARATAAEKLSGGEAYELFVKNCEMQGADPAYFDTPERILSDGLYLAEVKADADGYVSEVDALSIGNAIVELGGGRIKAEDDIDHAVGYACQAKIGDAVKRGDVLGVLHCRDKGQAAQVSENLIKAYRIVETETPSPELIRAVI